jgi:S-DNA-T family DNA segregation ATPase FtsK/SpoIIIE
MANESARETTAVVTGLGLVCIALFAGVSLYTYSPSDVLDYEAAGIHEIANKAGYIGAHLAHHAFCMYGATAWVITILVLVFGSMICATRTLASLFSRAFGAMLLATITCAACGWWDIIAPFGKHFSNNCQYPAGMGGILGKFYLAKHLISYFGEVGVLLVLAAAGLLACLLLAQSLTESALALVGRAVMRAGRWSFDAVVGRLQSASAPNRQPAMALAGASSAPNVKAVAEAPSAVQFEKLDSNSPAEEAPRSRLQIYNLVRGKNQKETETHLPAVRPAVRKALQEEDKLKAERQKVDAQAQVEAEETERRRKEALRQAEIAESERLQREQVAKEQYARESKALEKLEKERAAQERVRAKQQEKFAQTLAAAAPAAAAFPPGPAAPTAAGSEAPSPAPAPAPAAPKPQLPVNYDLPKYALLNANDIAPTISSASLKERGATVIQTLWDFKIGAKLAGIQSGPTVTMYELELDPGIKVQRVVGLQDNLAMAMKSENGVRIIAPIPGKNTIGIEIPNMEDHTVRMRPILESPQYRSKNWTLPLVLGRDSVGNPLIADLSPMPHLLIAGTTGSGKSVCVNSIILSIMVLRKPHEVKLILVDPKQVEMTDFKGIPHLLTPVVTDMKLAAGVLTWAVQKMDDRYERMSRVGVRNIATFNKLTCEERLARLPKDIDPNGYADPMPYIVIIVDEFADLMMTAGKEIEQAIARLAQKARAAGLHVILATQRPSADVVTGLIKTNLPCRICFQVKSKIDSRIVLDYGGAEKLAGKGDMLFMGAGSANLVRSKGVYISDDEIRGVVQSCKAQAEPEYSEEVERVAAEAAKKDEDSGETTENRQAVEMDEKFDEAVEVFLSLGRASTSLLQRRMGLGYTRAAKLCDQMAARGILGPDRGAKGRELLITQEAWDAFKQRASGAPAAPPVPSVTDTAAGKPGSQLDPALISKLSPVDGVKDMGEE